MTMLLINTNTIVVSWSAPLSKILKKKPNYLNRQLDYLINSIVTISCVQVQLAIY